MELKTTWDIVRENVPEGAEVPKEYILLREEAKKWIINCKTVVETFHMSEKTQIYNVACGEDITGRNKISICDACERFMKFFNIAKEESK